MINQLCTSNKSGKNWALTKIFLKKTSSSQLYAIWGQWLKAHFTRISYTQQPKKRDIYETQVKVKQTKWTCQDFLFPINLSRWVWLELDPGNYGVVTQYLSMPCYAGGWYSLSTSWLEVLLTLVREMISWGGSVGPAPKEAQVLENCLCFGEQCK